MVTPTVTCHQPNVVPGSAARRGSALVG